MIKVLDSAIVKPAPLAFCDDALRIVDKVTPAVSCREVFQKDTVSIQVVNRCVRIGHIAEKEITDTFEFPA